ncbi:dual specificity protein phosphatase family protein [Hoeflea sp. WL0058]|uniref:Dual specificity protein phosphatase family protein n=1 Tax=Flavimaribacter sediminis TaxID=2865987 RepID=A0AAE2ZIA1_9HYPH|nr:dual specificity protein phosphatase family protein [Flavimaribacter sediminis]MBW8636731.1 dual specificity protein phosphatase family protein [Flavimaribacter sediminis]
MKHKPRKLIVGAVISVAVMAGLFFGGLQATGNFHPVVDGELYRSGQVTPERLTRYAHEFGIHTVINLRGEQQGANWYDREIEASKELGLRHADFRMSASRDVSVEQAQALVDLMRSVPKPVLIHCKAGSDRTGLAVALYLAAIANADEETAEGQISVRYGHVGVPYLSAAYAMDESWEHLESWLGFEGS